MLLKDSKGRSGFFSRSNAHRLLASRRRVKALAVVAAMGLFFLGGIFFQRTGAIGQVIIPALQKLRYPLNYASGLMSDPRQLKIDISFKNYQKLAYNRKLALERDMLLAGFRDEVPATIRMDDQEVKVKLRLKGDMSDHWSHNYKWSFRIRTRGENSLLGMKQFSIQNPATRGFLNEWVFHELLRSEDFIALRYDFVEVTVNGKNQGIYALEEHFEKRLVENNKRREGPIIRFDDHVRWIGGHLPGSVGANDAFLQAPIDAFQSKKVRESEVYRKQFLQAKDLLESFRLQKLSVKEVFDSEKIALLFAIVDLFGFQHAMLDGQIRFYYNPVTSHLEPIGYDQQTIRDVSISRLEGEELELTNRGLNVWLALFFKDEEFYAEYIQALGKVSDPGYLDSFFERMKSEMEEKLAILHKEFPSYSFDARSLLYQNQQYIRKVLNPTTGLRAYLSHADSRNISLEIGSIHTLPIEVLGVLYQDSTEFPLIGKLLLPPREHLTPPDFHSLRFVIPNNLRWSDSVANQLTVTYQVLGTDSIRHEPVFPWSHLSSRFFETDFVRQLPNINDFEFLTVDREAKQIVIKRGSWELTENLIIPEGYQVICFENTRLDLSASAKILSYSPLQFHGTEEAPIVITSSDSTGQGLVVLNSGSKSVLEWVLFDNLSNPTQARWGLTGAVTFYESPVDIIDCQFSNNRCEDGLNIIRSNFSLNRTVFIGTMSDAFDGDFVTGVINECSFIRSGNDAIDVSGSILEITNAYIDGSGDKGLSIGENSRAEVKGLIIKNTEIALASKDLSHLSLQNVELTDCTLGFTVYKKKPEFGAASITVSGLTINGVEIPYVVERNSTLVVDGERIRSNQEDVKDILYGAEYGKSSK